MKCSKCQRNEVDSSKSLTLCEECISGAVESPTEFHTRIKQFARIQTKQVPRFKVHPPEWTRHNCYTQEDRGPDGVKPTDDSCAYAVSRKKCPVTVLCRLLKHEVMPGDPACPCWIQRG